MGSQKDPAPSSRVNWWLGAPRDGFTALAYAHLEDMQDGKFGGLRAIDATISAARAWGWGTKPRPEDEDEAA